MKRSRIERIPRIGRRTGASSASTAMDADQEREQCRVGRKRLTGDRTLRPISHFAEVPDYKLRPVDHVVEVANQEHVIGGPGECGCGTEAPGRLTKSLWLGTRTTWSTDQVNVVANQEHLVDRP